MTGNIKVVTVDYRLAPKHKFPAASEDVATVYRELLKEYAAESIGIYGCSAGGMLAASAVAWIQNKRLPRPGAIGIFCSGIDERMGDSRYIQSMLDVSRAPPQPPRKIHDTSWKTSDSYFGNVSADDPLAWPARSVEVLKKFPPTLVVSGTRDIVFSEAIFAHRSLVAAGVDAQLQLWEGMGHNFLVEMDLPESREACTVIAKFFNEHLHNRRLENRE